VTHITLSGFYAILRKACESSGGQTNWSLAHGISPQYVSDVLNARKDPGPKLLAALGLRRVVMFAATTQEEPPHG
jgi:hypothetical protein